jgi:hypothetical protein
MHETVTCTPLPNGRSCPILRRRGCVGLARLAAHHFRNVRFDPDDRLVQRGHRSPAVLATAADHFLD